MNDFPPHFCVLPFIGLHVSTTGDVAPCCEYDGSWGDLEQLNFDQARTSDQAVADRKAFLSSQDNHVQACWKCFDNEANGKVSLRQRSNNTLGQFLDKDAAREGRQTGSACAPYLDVRYSNLCNFKCRSCWHGSSSSWYQDAKALGNTAGPRAQISSITSIEQLLDLMNGDLSDIRQIYFAGGEPLMIAANYQLLERLIEQGRTDVELSFTTNGSYLGLGKRSILDLWAHFEDLKIELSVDATREDASALIRSGFSFETFCKTTQAIRDSCGHAKIRFGITVSALNLAELPRTLADLREHCGAQPSDFSIHPVQEPIHLRPSVLPKQTKSKALAVLQSYVDTLDAAWGTPDERKDLSEQLDSIREATRAPSDQNALMALGNTMQKLDDLRNEDIRTTLPDVFGKSGYPKLTTVQLARRKIRRFLSRARKAFQST